MAFKLPINLNAIAQGVGGLAFGDRSSEEDDSGVERLLDRISNGVLAEDRRAALGELQPIVAESASAQMAFGSMGFPVLLSILREEREDIEMVRGALETLVSALTPIENSMINRTEVQPASLNSELLSREGESVSLLLNLLSDDDFYIKYYTLQLLTALISNCCSRVQESILSTPRGITRLMDMLMDREVIRNEALLLLMYLTRDAEEIQKIVVFEGAFDKIFNIIKEEGGTEGGIVVQDCLELLNNLLRNNSTSQILLRETIGLHSIVSLLKLRKGGADGFSRQKTANLLGVLETVKVLLAGSPDADQAKDSNKIANQSVLCQNKLLDQLLMLSVENRRAEVAIRCMAFRCVGDLILGNKEICDVFSSTILGGGEDSEPALSSILRISLYTSSLQEYLAAEYVFKCFCKGNPEGQRMLASTIMPLSYSDLRGDRFTEGGHQIPFGSLLLRALISNNSENELEASGRAASVLSHILKDNLQCKERVVKIQLEVPNSLPVQELLLPRIIKCLAAVCPVKPNNELSNKKPSEKSLFRLQLSLLKLLVTWLADYPDAVDCFLQSPAHLAYVIELVLNNATRGIAVTGLAVVLLGECIVFNKATEENKDAFMVVDAISQRIGLTTYFNIWEEMQKCPLFLPQKSFSWLPKRSSRATISENIRGTGTEEDESISEIGNTKLNYEDPLFITFFDVSFVSFIKQLEPVVRSQIVEIFSRPKSKVAIIPAEMEQKNGESNNDYVIRLKSFLEKQCREMQDLLGRNAALAEDMAKTRNGTSIIEDPISTAVNSRNTQGINGIASRMEVDNLRNELQAACSRIEMMKTERMKCEEELSSIKHLAGKYEADLKSLSDAYNSLEQTNYRLELEIRSLKGDDSAILPDLEAIREEGRQEAQKESEAELNDLLVCLGQEQSRVEKLSTKLTELGIDVDALLEGVGEEADLRDNDDEDDDDNEDK